MAASLLRVRPAVVLATALSIPVFGCDDATGPDVLDCELPLPVPELSLTNWDTVVDQGVPFVRILLRLENHSRYPDALFAEAPDLPPCGLNRNASRTWLEIIQHDGRRIYGYCAIHAARELRDFTVAVPLGEVPSHLFIELNDRRCDRRVWSNVVAVGD